MDKFDGLFFDLSEIRGYQLDGTWRRYRGMRDIRRRVERCEQRLSPLFQDVVDTSGVAVDGYRFEVEFNSGAVAWRKRRRKFPDGSVQELRIYVPSVVQFLGDEVGLEDTLRRWLAVAIQAEFPELSAVQALREPAPFVPLLALSCVPRAGRAGRWHRSPDVDAYARAASVLCDLARPVLSEGLGYSSWPILELLPTTDATEMQARQWGRAYCVPAAGASLMESKALAAKVAVDFQDALTRRSLEDDSDLDGLGGVLRDRWRQADYEFSLSTSALRRNGRDQKLLVEYASTPRGGKFRPVVKSDRGIVRGDWQVADGGSEVFAGLEPGVGYSWLSDGRVQLTVPTLSPSRQIVDLAADTPLVSKLSIDSEGDFWSFLDAARATARDESIKSVGNALYLMLANATPGARQHFAAFWAVADGALHLRPVLEAASETLGFVSSDVFEDVRGWIILQGLETFTEVIACPDALRERRFTGLDQVEAVVAELGALSGQVVVGEFPDDSSDQPIDAPPRGGTPLAFGRPRDP